MLAETGTGPGPGDKAKLLLKNKSSEFQRKIKDAILTVSVDSGGSVSDKHQDNL